MPEEYDDKNKCPKCSGLNKIKVVDSIEDAICECETTCGNCGHLDYWAYGYYESKIYEK
jgi:hypothetical protein